MPPSATECHRQVSELNTLWKKVSRPAGDPLRGGLPGERDRKWFASCFCANQSMEWIADDRSIWPYVSMIPQHDCLALLAAHPTTLEYFFEVDVKVVRGVRHLVVGTSDRQPGVRDSHRIRSFLLKACHLALTKSLADADAVVGGSPARGPRTIFRRRADTDGAREDGSLPTAPSPFRHTSSSRHGGDSEAELRMRRTTAPFAPQDGDGRRQRNSWTAIAHAQDAMHRFRVGGASRPGPNMGGSPP